jgi:lysophospholipase L1-like esterase
MHRRPSPRTTGRRLAVAAAAVAATCAAGLTACEPPPDTYVALGDSYTAGPMIPMQGTAIPGCLRSDHNYPNLARTLIRAERFVDVSCSGAKTDDLYAPQSQDVGPDNPPQLDALDDMTKVVTLGIGGNDIGFTGIVETCASQNPTGPGCKPTYVHDGRDELRERIAATAPKIDRAIAAIRARAPRAKVFVVGYPTVVPETGTGCYPIVPILPGDIEYLRGVAKALNAMLRDRATAGGATYIDTARSSVGHDVCAVDHWVEGLVPAAPAAPVHPNATGMRNTSIDVAKAVNAVVR